MESLRERDIGARAKARDGTSRQKWRSGGEFAALGNHLEGFNAITLFPVGETVCTNPTFEACGHLFNVIFVATQRVKIAGVHHLLASVNPDSAVAVQLSGVDVATRHSALADGEHGAHLGFAKGFFDQFWLE